MLKKVHPHFKRKKYHEWKKNVRQKTRKEKKVVYTVLHIYRWELGRRRVLSEVRFFIHVKDS